MQAIQGFIFGVSVMVTFVLVARLLLRKFKVGKFNAGDYVSMVLLILKWVHAVSVYYAIVYGQNQVPAAYRKGHVFTPAEIKRRELGSKLLLLSRSELVTFIWLSKAVLFLFYKQLIKRMRWERAILWSFWISLAITYVATMVSIFSECKPFNNYWVVVPDPGPCSRGAKQLYIQGSLNIATDLALMFLPLGVLFQVRRPLLQKVQLGVLFSAGVFVILTTVVRLDQNPKNKMTQLNRSWWANAELAAATIVAHTPTMYVTLFGAKADDRYGLNSGSNDQSRKLDPAAAAHARRRSTIKSSGGATVSAEAMTLEEERHDDGTNAVP